MPLKPMMVGWLPSALLGVLIGCGSSPLGERAPAANDARADGATQNQPPPQARQGAPIRAVLTGPLAPRAGETLTLFADIERLRPMQVPVEIQLELPAGVELIEGQRVHSLAPNTQLDSRRLRYVIRMRELPASDVRLVVHAQSSRFGFHTEQAYRFGRRTTLPASAAKDGVEIKVGNSSFGRSVDITPR